MIDKAFLSTDLFLLTLTVGLYCLGTAVYRRIRMPLLHPVLLTFVAVIVFLRAADIGYARYQEATGILDFALGMSVVALGYLLYEQVEQLRGSLLPVGIATLAGCVAGVLSVVYIAMAFGAGREILNSIAPKSVTVPIAVSVSGPLGGIVPVTSVVVFCVGIFGSIFGEWILRRCGVRDAEARGFALGAAAHGIGTARAIEMGAVEGALSGLAMALMGLATALLMPLYNEDASAAFGRLARIERSLADLGASGAFEPACGGGQVHLAHQSDAAASGLDQVLGGQPTADDIVPANRAERATRIMGRGEHHRGAAGR